MAKTKLPLSQQELQTAAQVAVTPLGSPTYTELQKIHDLTRSAGHLDGGAITDATGGNINVAAGQGFIRSADNDTSTLYPFDWAAASAIAIPANSVRYVYVDYNAGTPIVAVTATNSFDYRTQFPLGIATYELGTMYINDTPHSIGRIAGRIARRNYEVEGRSRADTLGGLILSETGTKKIGITTGVTWFRGTRDTFAAFDSNAADTFTRYYQSATPGLWTAETAQTTLPLSTFDDGSGSLQTIGNNNYANYWIYIGVGGGVALVYGRTDNNNVAEAQAQQPPVNLPLRFQEGSILLGRYITRRQGGSSSVSAVESAFTRSFVGTAATEHNGLAGIQGGAVDDYQHLTSAELAAVQAGGSGQSFAAVLAISSFGI